MSYGVARSDFCSIRRQAARGTKLSSMHGRSMIERVIFSSDADDDVAASYDWYESREPGLGEDFLRSIEACVRGIQRHPEMYPVAIDEFRRAPIRRFPFEIFYELTASSITIYSVFHCSQDPQKWRKRLLNTQL